MKQSILIGAMLCFALLIAVDVHAITTCCTPGSSVGQSCGFNAFCVTDTGNVNGCLGWGQLYCQQNSVGICDNNGVCGNLETEDTTTCAYDCACSVENQREAQTASGCCGGLVATPDTVLPGNPNFCCYSGVPSVNGVCQSCGNGVCDDGAHAPGFNNYGENVTTCPIDCQLGPSACVPPETWNTSTLKCDPPVTVCDAALAASNPAVNCDQGGSTLTTVPGSTYCSQGVSNQLAAPGFCCPIGRFYDSASTSCQPTFECSDPGLCTQATTYPASLGTYIANSFCISASNPGYSNSLAACCNVGTKYGQTPYYDYSDASGNAPAPNVQIY